MPTDFCRPFQTGEYHFIPLTVAHAATTFSLWQDPQLYRYTPIPGPYTLAELEARFTRLERRSPADNPTEYWWNWFIEYTGEIVGLVEVTYLPTTPTAELAYYIFTPYQGRGLGTQAVKQTLDYLQQNVPLTQVTATVDARNVASIKILTNNGFTQTASQRIVMKGEACTELIFNKLVASPTV